MTIDLWRIVNRILFSGGIVLLSAGCATLPATPAPTVAATRAHPSPTVIPAITTIFGVPTPTVIPTPTAISPTMAPTPSAPPATSGPGLIFKKSVDGREVLIVVDATGRERREQSLPEGAVVPSLANAVSPDGRWLAFYTGSAENRSGGEPFDLALNLLDLSSGQARVLTLLLSADYPDNFRALADALAQQGISPGEGADLSLILRDAFVYGIHALAWSPDGRYLAFAGQMDGLSSDVYVYDREAQTIRRLGDEAEQIQSITWSPDGRWVVYESTHQVGAGMDIQTYAAAADGSVVKALTGGVTTLWGWLGPSVLLQLDITNDALQSVDVETGALRTLWNGRVLSCAFDPADNVLAVVGAGLFLVDLSNGESRQVAEAASSVEFIGIHDWRFIATIWGESFFVLADGTLVETGFDTDRVHASPDLRAIVVLGETLQVYTGGNYLEREIALVQPASSIEQIIWRSDAPGLFFTLDSTLYALDWLSGEVYLVDRDVPGRWQLDYTVSTPASIGPEAVWDAPRDTEFADCHFTADPAITCVASVMQAEGASPQAIEFTRLLDGHAFMTSFTECGVVDVAQIIVAPRLNDILQYVLLNGTPRVIYVGEDIGEIDITHDPLYPALHQQYPELTIWESLNGFDHAESFPSGGQRFVIRYDLVDGCHICRTGDSAFVAFDFDRSGQFLGTEFLYLEE